MLLFEVLGAVIISLAIIGMKQQIKKICYSTLAR